MHRIYTVVEYIYAKIKPKLEKIARSGFATILVLHDVENNI